MKYQPQKYSDKELLELFPDARNIISLKIKECREVIKKKEQEIAAALNDVYMLETDQFTEWFCEKIIKMFMVSDLVRMEKNLFRLNHLKYLSNPEFQKNHYYAFEQKIETARQFPIAELARSKLELKQTGKNYACSCPWHEDRRPSFYIYTGTNTFICFSCNQKGNSITLAMHLYGVGFKDAVELLQN